MTPLDYRIDPEVFAQHPGYCRGLLVFVKLDNTRPDPALAGLLGEAESSLRSAIGGNVADDPRIAAWRDAYRRFGARPSEHRSSIEAMARRVLKPDSLPSINPLVDIGNIVSLRHVLPAGVHPLPARHGALELRPARAGDTFAPPDGGPAEQPPPGEIVLADGHEVLTRRWTWRQAAGTRTLPRTTALFFNVDDLPPTSMDDVQAAMTDVVALVSRFCGGELVLSAVLDASNPHARIAS